MSDPARPDPPDVSVPPIPDDDDLRVAAVRALGLLDSPPEERFDRITRTAARVFDVPVAFINLVDVDRQWSKSCVGLGGVDADRGISFCAHAIGRAEATVVPDAREDPRFAENPLVVGPPHIVFYAGQPLRGMGGFAVGTLCIVDHQPRTLDDDDLDALHDLAEWAESELESVELSEALAGVRIAEARLRAVMDAVPDGIVTFDVDGMIRSANPAAVRLFGYPLDELVGRRAFDLIGRDGQEQIAALRRPDDRRRFPRGEVEATHADGTRFPMEIAISYATLPSAAADPQQFAVAVGRNIAGRKRVEAELEELRARNERILASAGGGIIALDRDGRVTTANPAAARLLGRPREELLGADLHQLAHHSREDGTPYAWDDCPTRATIVHGIARHADDEVYWRPDGTAFHAEYTSTPIEVDGAVTGAVLTLIDISERTRIERMKDEFVSVVSHELRTPLTSIKGSLGLVAGGVFGDLPGEASRMLDIALTNTDRLVRLINDILDLERIGSGRIAMDLRPVQLREVLTESVESVAGAARQADVTLELVAADGEVVVDPDRLVQALTNLLGNAVKFSPSGASVVLSAEVDDEVVLRVTDVGRGIPEDKLDRIFERFEQVDASDSREKGGTGLGLPIVRAIAEQHGGRVEVASRHGEGSTFTIVLPRDAAGGEGS